MSMVIREAVKWAFAAIEVAYQGQVSKNANFDQSVETGSAVSALLASALKLGLDGDAVLYGRGDMAVAEIVFHMLSHLAGLKLYRIQHGLLRENDWPSLIKAAGRLSDMRLHLLDEEIGNVEELEVEILRLHTDYGVRAVFIDDVDLLLGTHDVALDIGLLSAEKDFDIFASVVGRTLPFPSV